LAFTQSVRYYRPAGPLIHERNVANPSTTVTVTVTKFHSSANCFQRNHAVLSVCLSFRLSVSVTQRHRVKTVRAIVEILSLPDRAISFHTTRDHYEIWTALPLMECVIQEAYRKVAIFSQ